MVNSHPSNADLRSLVRTLEPQLIAWRRDLHQHPESSFTEYRTASLIVQHLQALGYAVTMGAQAQRGQARLWVPDAQHSTAARQWALAQGANPALVQRMGNGLTGLWADLVCPNDNYDGTDCCEEYPLVALRFDMDALELPEAASQTHRPARKAFASCRAGLMHACGHDGHVAVGLGLASLLAQLRPLLRGTVRLIFQPAEEGGIGAHPMELAGALHGVDYLIGMHLGMQAEHTGDVVCGTDCFLATTTFEITFTGSPAHAGMAPQEGKNALLAATTAVQNIHAITRHGDGISRINIGQLRSGDAPNIIPPQAWLCGETRGISTTINDFMMGEVERMAHAAAQMWGCECSIRRIGECPSAASSTKLTDRVQSIAKSMGLFRNIRHTAHFWASEDFTWLMNAVQKAGGQAVFIQVGAKRSAGHHTSHFDFDEQALCPALELLARVTLSTLNAQGIV
jgi:aminobenzoyl-glutamate utilization protein A